MEDFDDMIWRGLKRVLSLLLTLLTLAACAPGSSPSVDSIAPAFSPAPGGGSPAVSRTLSLVGGVDFTCFNLTLEDGSGRIYCRRSGGGVPDARLGLTSASFELYAESATGFDRLEVWDDTICAEATVGQRPYSRTAGQATYCWGDASLGAQYAMYPLIYSGPNFSAPQHGSAEVLFHVEQPFAGSDSTVGLFTNEGGVWNVMTDSSSFVHTGSENCSLTASDLTCGSFSVGL